jgi:hypothetical protein
MVERVTEARAAVAGEASEAEVAVAAGEATVQQAPRPKQETAPGKVEDEDERA